MVNVVYLFIFIYGFERRDHLANEDDEDDNNNDDDNDTFLYGFRF